MTDLEFPFCQPINPNPSPSAQSAAVQAFRASQAAHANAKLSSSAAAAALRKHTPTPTSVEDVQTRRMLQRKQSVSSIGNSKESIQRGQDVTVRRANSMSSMSKRTFRDSSPGLNSPVGVGHTEHKDEIDPVPPLPRVYATATAPTHRRAISGGNTGRRAISPQTQLVGTQATSGNDPGQPTQGSTAGPSLGLQRRSSRSSINFSYPINARPNSPRQPSITSVLADTPSIRTLSPAGSLNTNFSPHVYAPQKETRADSIGQTSQVDWQCSTGAGHQSIHADGSNAKYQMEKNARSPEEKNGQQYDPDSLDPHTLASGHIPPDFLRRHPSPIPEIHEIGEGSRDGGLMPEKQEPGYISLLREEARKEINALENKRYIRKRRASPSTVSDSSLHLPERQTQPRAKDWTRPSAKRLQAERPSSLSPSRSTRFSEHLEIAFPGDHLHEPPPRSKSPVKSALKTTAPTHTVPSDPSDTHNLKIADVLSESEGTSVLSDEGSRLSWKRRPAKVTFEDEAEILGATASPPTSPDSIVPSSPQSKWNDNLRSRCSHTNDLDDVMKPRPALPSFGSIRGRRRIVEDDKSFTIRPENGRPLLADSVFADSFSGDFAIGAVLESHSRQTCQTSRAVPWPSEVTSLDGSGFDSPSESESSSDEADPSEFILPGQDISGLRHFRGNELDQLDKNSIARVGEYKKTDVVVPIIAIQPATPMFEEYPKARPERNGIPRSFPDISNLKNSLDISKSERKLLNRQKMSEINSANEPIDTDSESGDSVYSDAAENLDDLEGDGFGSINAIVSGPTSQGRILHASSPADPPVSSVGSDNDVPQPNVEIYSTEIQHQSPPIASPRKEEVSARTVYDKDNLREEHPVSKPVRQRSLKQAKMNGAPRFGGISSEKPVQESAPQEPRRNTTESQSPASATILDTRRRNFRNSALSSPIQNNPIYSEIVNKSKAVGQQPRRAQTVSYGSLARQSPQRNPSNGSDSSSSFKRERRSPAGTRTYSLRRTMRSGAGHSKADDLEKSNHAAASSSISHQHHPFSSGDSHPILRGTLRGSSSVLHLKSQSTSFSGFRSLRSKHPSGFKSRFADSSDEELDVQKFTPVRGIPRRRGAIDGDSTDLEDSSDSDAPRNVVRRLRSKRPISKRGAAPVLAVAAGDTLSNHKPSATTLLHDQQFPTYQEKPKRGVLSRMSLSRRHAHGETKIRKSEIESAARKDTPLERSQPELDRVRDAKLYMGGYAYVPGTVTNTSGPSTPAPKSKWPRLSPRSAKQTNKLTRQSGNSKVISWPLPAPGGTPPHIPRLSSNARDNGRGPGLNSVAFSSENPHRPHTSDGLNRSKSQIIPRDTSSDVDSTWTSRFLHNRHNRRGTESALNPQAGGGSSGGATMATEGKKKSRFPRLRKAFGLS
ncbi:hypothetical protein CPC735_031770 [Coccidioides posadasii C735 delta SOWgp]|uniref:Uncharacterized protein n=1 Tax=Coccidioides posadasii (strain C735) TaxID=222929 RepID=C5P551_COCP7|nr:hypothetical protein CPC735_031770 [Coccidioides posadasii C735 delta SOWgp]EER27841.1 hypothetical protein CPC735_031770 [Coccidioides posadasii C735 delta SOWgp]|eukprot:XP_003069986.1 hypothetical protein CPC735_031770 [Coccidioides posadasii C735 delta SOWgp]